MSISVPLYASHVIVGPSAKNLHYCSNYDEALAMADSKGRDMPNSHFRIYKLDTVVTVEAVKSYIRSVVKV